MFSQINSALNSIHKYHPYKRPSKQLKYKYDSDSDSECDYDSPCQGYQSDQDAPTSPNYRLQYDSGQGYQSPCDDYESDPEGCKSPNYSSDCYCSDVDSDQYPDLNQEESDDDSDDQ